MERKIFLLALILAMLFAVKPTLDTSVSATGETTGKCDPLPHLYEDECDIDCMLCGERRSVAHKYTDDCDELCNLCQRRRAVAHTFTDDADPDCNECGRKRPSFLVGDLDRNDSLDLNDAIYALYYVNFPKAYPVNQSVDFDGNEKNDLNDAVHLLYHVNFPDTYPLAPAPSGGQ